MQVVERAFSEISCNTLNSRLLSYWVARVMNNLAKPSLVLSNKEQIQKKNKEH